MLEVSAVRLHACTKTLVPLVNCIVNDALVDFTPHLLQTLFQFVSVVHPRLVHSLSDDAPDPVINRLKVRSVRWPKIRWKERRRVTCSRSRTVSHARSHILKVYMKIATERKANQSHDRCPGDVARQPK